MPLAIVILAISAFAISTTELGIIGLLFNDPTIFMLYENWESQSALDTHFEQPYVQKVLKAFEVTLAEPITANFLHKIT